MDNKDSTVSELTTEGLLGLYRQMRRIRDFEMTVYEGVERGLIAGGPHLYVGEEAVAVGVCSALRPTLHPSLTWDHRVSNGSEAGQLLARVAQLMGDHTMVTGDIL